MVSVNLPMFPGFYYSSLDSEMDYTEEREAENMAERDEEENEQTPLDASDYADIFYWCMDYSKAHEALARDWCDAFARVVKDETGIEFAYQFEEMTSPREYNFTTDKVFCNVAPRTLRAILKATPESTLRECVEERHSSRSGFISFYSNDLDEWRAQGLTNWDYHQWGTVIAAFCAAHGIDENAPSNFMLESTEDFYVAFDNAMDWQKFDEKRAEKRAEKEAEQASEQDGE